MTTSTSDFRHAAPSVGQESGASLAEVGSDLPDAAFDAAMADYLATQRMRVHAMYKRHRAIFAEHLVAALLGGKVSIDPGAAWDIDWIPVAGRRPIRIQVKCSGEFLPRYPASPAAATWDVTPPTKGFDESQPDTALPPGHHCDVFVLARHTGRDITNGWRFVVAPAKALEGRRRVNERFLRAAGLRFVAPRRLAEAVRDVAECDV